MPLKLYQSDKLEILLEHLADSMQSDRCGDPLAPETVIVQNNGMAQWVAQNLAEKIGIVANVNFILPTGFTWDLIRKFIDAPQRADLEKDELVWRIFAALYGHEVVAPEIENYIAEPNGEIKCFQLANQLADIYDQYQMFRQDWILDWDDTGCTDEHWQVKLWQHLSDFGLKQHRSKLLKQFFDLSSTNYLDIEKLPKKIAIFGIDTMPPAYLSIFSLLSAYIDISIYTFNPCAEYWGDIASEKYQANLRLTNKDPQTTEYMDSGNLLLSSMGKVGRDYHEIILELDSHIQDYEEFQCFSSINTPTNLLGSVQQDILLLRNGNSNSAVENDNTIQLHNCHTRLREVEVLYDQLLDVFNQESTIEPQEIVVMAPDINKYAPFIEAVFGRNGLKKQESFDEQYSKYIPWSIADRTSVSETPVLQAFMQIIGLYSSRVTAADIIRLIKVEAIANKFDLSELDIQNIQQWIEESGIRWGLDAHFRKRFDLPEVEINSWKFGLERMLLGYSVASEEVLFDDKLPYLEIEGSNAESAGKLTHFIYKISDLIEVFSQKHSAIEWQDIINSLLETFFTPEDDDESILQNIRNCIGDFVDIAEEQEFYQGRVLSVAIINEYLTNALMNQMDSGRFLAGKVTFCTLQPMRAIPFKVVCLLGMNDDEFPRQQKKSSLDLITQNAAKLGDRNRRDDDRYLFLQAILSARQYLYISYIGRSVIDNSKTLPSALVSELYDYLERFYAIMPQQITTQHPLQPFDKKYFSDNGELFSYAEEWLPASSAIKSLTAENPFFTSMLEEPDSTLKVLTISDLVSFFAKPARYLLRQRMGVNFDLQIDEVEEDEPFYLTSLDDYKIKEKLLDCCLFEHDETNFYKKLCLSGTIPHGHIGEKSYNNIAAEVDTLAAKVKPYLEGDIENYSGTINISDFEVSASITNITADGMLLYRVGKLRPIDRVELRVKHLFLQVAFGFSLPAIFIAQDQTLIIQPVDDPGAELSAIFKQYWQGLYSPLHFFPYTSFEFASTLYKSEDQDYALTKAEAKWYGGFNSQFADASDQYNSVLYRGVLPLDQEFAEVAQVMFTPELFGYVDE